MKIADCSYLNFEEQKAFFTVVFKKKVGTSAVVGMFTACAPTTDYISWLEPSDALVTTYLELMRYEV